MGDLLPNLINLYEKLNVYSEVREEVNLCQVVYLTKQYVYCEVREEVELVLSSLFNEASCVVLRLCTKRWCFVYG